VVKRSLANFEIKQFECTAQLELFNKSSDFETSYWDFGDSTNSNISNPGVHEYKTPGIYKIRLITNENKLCPDTALLEVEIKGLPADKLKAANVFTPDGDGFNDCFHFDGGLNECSEFKLVVYNRWGQKVFETKDFSECWNGRLNNTGLKCPEGTYFYICEYKGESAKMKPLFSGTVTLIRK
jgi:gliding motility-associated-like protein